MHLSSGTTIGDNYCDVYANVIANDAFHAPLDLFFARILPSFNPELLELVIDGLVGTVITSDREWSQGYFPEDQAEDVRYRWAQRIPEIFEKVRDAVTEAKSG